ncbi:MAG: hypothetical protein QGG40_05425, partial [Myxococcota bacterium]|nr:hypothetical protein [Myxococcota bacterium]
DTDTDTDTDTDCDWPTEDLYDDTPIEGAVMEPYYFAVSAVAGIEDGLLYDYGYDGTNVSANITFAFYDESQAELCSVIYDLSESTASGASWETSSGGEIYESFKLDLRDGYTDCTTIPSPVWGSDDIRDVIEANVWGLGWGEMLDLLGYLEPAVEDAGQDWENDWEPYVSSSYLFWEAIGMAYELNYGLAYKTDCGELATDSSGSPLPLNTPTSGPLETGLWMSNPFYLLYAEYLVN